MPFNYLNNTTLAIIKRDPKKFYPKRKIQYENLDNSLLIVGGVIICTGAGATSGDKCRQMNNKKMWKSIEFLILFIASMVMVLISIKSFIEAEHHLSSVLTSYDCRLWKEATLIYSHDIKLSSGAEYGIRTKNLTCDAVEAPIPLRTVEITYKGSMLLMLKQNGKELLNYDVLAQDSDDSSLTVYLVSIFLLIMTFASGYKLLNQRGQSN